MSILNNLNSYRNYLDVDEYACISNIRGAFDNYVSTFGVNPDILFINENFRKFLENALDKLEENKCCLEFVSLIRNLDIQDIKSDEVQYEFLEKAFLASILKRNSGDFETYIYFKIIDEKSRISITENCGDFDMNDDSPDDWVYIISRSLLIHKDLVQVIAPNRL